MKTPALPAKKVDLMYLSFFSRLPTSEEKGVIDAEGFTPADLVWLLMNTREFIFVQ